MNYFYNVFISVTLLVSFVCSAKNINEDAIFFDKYVDEEMYLDNSFEYEYICAQPINTNDCRAFSVDILKPPFSNKFTITNLLKKKDISFFEILVDEEIYYIQSKRLMNGINITNFRTEPLPVVSELNLEKQDSNTVESVNNEIFQDTYLNNSFTLDGVFYICNKKIKKLNCDSHDILENPVIKVLKNISNRNENIIYEVSYQDKDNNQFIYWINDYIIDMFSK